MLCRIAAFTLAFCVLPCLAQSKPQRIVSLNLCTDQLLLALADRARIQSLTWLITDPDSSPVAHAAAGIPLNHGRAEEILPLKPDLVVAGRYSAAFTVTLLQRLGYRVLVLDEPSNIAEVRTNIRRLGDALHEPQRAQMLIQSLDATLRAATLNVRARSVVVYRAGGYTVASGTLAHDVLTRLGLSNAAAQGDAHRAGMLPIDQLLLRDPQVLIVDAWRDRPASLSHEVLRHPALRHFRQRRQVIEVPAALWSCGTHHVAQAAALIASGLRAAPTPKPATW